MKTFIQPCPSIQFGCNANVASFNPKSDLYPLLLFQLLRLSRRWFQVQISWVVTPSSVVLW